MEWARLPDSHRCFQKRLQDCNWAQALEGDIDSAHIAFLHFGQTPSERVANTAGEYRDVSPRFFVDKTDYGLLIGARRDEDEESYYWRISHFLTPFYTYFPGEPFAESRSAHAWVPMDDENHWAFTVTWRAERPLSDDDYAEFNNPNEGIYPELIPGTFRVAHNKSNDYMIDRELQRNGNFTGLRGIGHQDVSVTEGMGNIVDRTTEHLGVSDTAIIAFRRLMLQLVNDLQEGIEPDAASRGDVFKVRATDRILKRDVDWKEGLKGDIASPV